MFPTEQSKKEMQGHQGPWFMDANAELEAKWIYVFMFPVHLLADLGFLPTSSAISILISTFKGL